MFEGPEYASYIALCRELRLERRFEEGDWWATSHREPIAWKSPSMEPIYISDPELCNGDGGNFPGYEDEGQFYFWLPRLDQWLAMLEKADVTEVDLHGTTGFQHVAMDGANLHDSDLSLRQGIGPTREEAAGRLWLAVRKR